MKLRAVVVLSGLLFSLTCFADGPKTKEEFLAAVREAFMGKNIAKIRALAWEKGQTDFDNQQEERILPMMVKGFDGSEVATLEPMTKPLETVIMQGRRLEPTHAVDGMVKFTHTSADKSSKWSFSLPYAAIDGVFYIVGTKSTDVGWKGPADKPLVLNVQGSGQTKVKVHVKYNASGVDLETDPDFPSAVFYGQYISEVTATSDSDDTDVVLDLKDQSGEFHYRSAPLKGKGTIHYHKGDASAPEPTPQAGTVPDQ